MRVSDVPKMPQTPRLPPKRASTATLLPSCERPLNPPVPAAPNFRPDPGMIVFLSTRLVRTPPDFLYTPICALGPLPMNQVLVPSEIALTNEVNFVLLRPFGIASDVLTMVVRLEPWAV